MAHMHRYRKCRMAMPIPLPLLRQRDRDLMALPMQRLQPHRNRLCLRQHLLLQWLRQLPHRRLLSLVHLLLRRAQRQRRNNSQRRHPRNLLDIRR